MLSAKNLRKFELKIMTISFIVMKLKKMINLSLKIPLLQLQLKYTCDRDAMLDGYLSLSLFSLYLRETFTYKRVTL